MDIEKLQKQMNIFLLYYYGIRIYRFTNIAVERKVQFFNFFHFLDELNKTVFFLFIYLNIQSISKT